MILGVVMSVQNNVSRDIYNQINTKIGEIDKSIDSQDIDRRISEIVSLIKTNVSHLNSGKDSKTGETFMQKIDKSLNDKIYKKMQESTKLKNGITQIQNDQDGKINQFLRKIWGPDHFIYANTYKEKVKEFNKVNKLTTDLTNLRREILTTQLPFQVYKEKLEEQKILKKNVMDQIGKDGGNQEAFELNKLKLEKLSSEIAGLEEKMGLPKQAKVAPQARTLEKNAVLVAQSEQPGQITISTPKDRIQNGKIKTSFLDNLNVEINRVANKDKNDRLPLLNNIVKKFIDGDKEDQAKIKKHLTELLKLSNESERNFILITLEQLENEFPSPLENLPDGPRKKLV